MSTSIFGGTPEVPEKTNSAITIAASPETTEIVSDGDVVLYVEHDSSSGKLSHSFRISASALKTRSKYFDSLLRSGGFGEGAQIEEKLGKLRQKYGTVSKAPVGELPVVEIRDVGRISSIKSLEALFADFLYILHGQETSTGPLVANLANLAIVADRFDALQTVSDYVRRKRIVKTLDAKTKPKQDTALTEEKMRQRLLVGVMLDYSPWVERYSARLIIKGLVGREADSNEPLWWELPGRMEDELAFRRECALETMQSVQEFFLSQYSSRTRQCRLGYDSSPECDSFQFGEMVRFFLRAGTLRLQSIIQESAEPPLPYDGDFSLLLERLKQVPEYQVDRNHSHCGIRTRIVPMLDLIATMLQYIGVCGDCWSEDRPTQAWLDGKRPLFWKKLSHTRPVNDDDHVRRHTSVRALFTATDRDWS